MANDNRNVILSPAPEGYSGWRAHIPGVPGEYRGLSCFGDTIPEALEKLAKSLQEEMEVQARECTCNPATAVNGRCTKCGGAVSG
jgi:hypothetical protein